MHPLIHWLKIWWCGRRGHDYVYEDLGGAIFKCCRNCPYVDNDTIVEYPIETTTLEPKMEDYQKRVIEEKEELDKKIEKLTTFLYDKTKLIPEVHSTLLVHQLSHMKSYSGILELRIRLFKSEKQ